MAVDHGERKESFLGARDGMPAALSDFLSVHSKLADKHPPAPGPRRPAPEIVGKFV